MREQRETIDSLAREAYGHGRLKANSVGEWFWSQEAGGRVYLGWSLSGAEHRLRAVIGTEDRRSLSRRA
jgi:hypothetical protein